MLCRKNRSLCRPSCCAGNWAVKVLLSIWRPGMMKTIKGVDDLLAAGQKPRRRTGDEVPEFFARVRQRLYGLPEAEVSDPNAAVDDSPQAPDATLPSGPGGSHPPGVEAGQRNFVAAVAAPAWEPPARFDLLDVPSFPEGVLTGWLG